MKTLSEFTFQFKSKRILFLQGPMGSFFKRLRLNLIENNQVWQIGFNKGDEFFSQKDYYFPYKGDQNYWLDFFKKFINNYSIQIIFLLGDCRYYHKTIIDYIKKNRINILVYVFEEGYIRPNYITVELFGVNDYSSLPRNYSFYENLNKQEKIIEENEKFFRGTYFKTFLNAAQYYLISSFFKYQYPFYKHHRNFSTRKEFYIILKNMYSWIIFKFKERDFQKNVINKLSKKYFLVPLQTKDDFQIKVHSDFDSIDSFIKYVLCSFAKNASDYHNIIFKHHPYDRGRISYYKYIKDLAKELNITGRVKVISDVKLPLLLRNAIGTITINSTVGMSSIYHKTPVIYLGRSLHNIEGLTAYGISLKDFWNNRYKINYDLYENYRNYIIKKTQINDNFYI